MKCLKRLWDHLQAQVLIASHGARRELQGEMQRPVHAQSVPVEPTAKEVSDHNMAHQPYAAWCGFVWLTKLCKILILNVLRPVVAILA